MSGPVLSQRGLVIHTNDPQIYMDYPAFVAAAEFGAQGDGITDDTAALQAGITALAGTGIGLLLSARGTYRVASAGLTVPSGTRIYGCGATIAANIPGSTLFQCAGSLAGTQFALHANAVQGSLSIQVSGSSLSAGQSLYVNDGNAVGLYVVQSVSPGAGFQTVTLDRASLYPLTAATGIARVVPSVPTNVLVNGLHMTGSCLRFFDVVAAINVRFEDITIDDGSGFASDTIACASFSGGALRCMFKNIAITGPRGLGFLSAEACEGFGYTFTGHNVPSSNITGNGLNFDAAAACGVFNVSIAGAFDGAHFHGTAPLPNRPDGSQVGSYGCFVQGGEITGCIDSGVLPDQSSDCWVRGLLVTGTQTNAGINVNDATSGFAIRDCSVVQNLKEAIAVSGPDVTIDNVDVSSQFFNAGTSTFGVLLLPVATAAGLTYNYKIRGLRSTYSPAGASFAVLAEDPNALGCNVSLDQCSLVGGVIAENGVNLAVRNSQVSCPYTGSGAIAFLGTGQGTLENVQASSIGGSTTYQSTSGATVWLFGRVTATGAGTQFGFAGPVNRGTVVLNGSGAGTISWPAATSESTLSLTLKTKSTAASAQPFITVTVNAGTGFTLASSAGDDASTYYYTVN